MRWLLLLATAVVVPLIGWQLLEHGVIWFNSPSAADLPVRGLDVSHHQGPIDWPRVASEKMEFAYIKATEGGDFRDSRFTENWDGAGAAFIPRGAYHFFTLCKSGREQAQNFIEVVPTESELPPAIDLEFGGNCQRRPSQSAFHNDLTDFIAAVESKYGRRPLLYVTEEFLDAYPVHELGYDLWIRSIYTKPHRPHLVWQYHCRARVDGIEGPVDLNASRTRWWRSHRI